MLYLLLSIVAIYVIAVILFICWVATNPVFDENNIDKF